VTSCSDVVLFVLTQISGISGIPVDDICIAKVMPYNSVSCVNLTAICPGCYDFYATWFVISGFKSSRYVSV